LNERIYHLSLPIGSYFQPCYERRYGKSKAEQSLKKAILKNYGEEAKKFLVSIFKDSIPGLLTGI
jgi:hypothetical protein